MYAKNDYYEFAEVEEQKSREEEEEVCHFILIISACEINE